MGCKFCRSHAQPMRETFYQVSICERCDVLLRAHDAKRDLETLEQRVEQYAKNVRRIAPRRVRLKPRRHYLPGEYFGTERVPRGNFAVEETPYSKTEKELKGGSRFFRILSSFAPGIYRKSLDPQTRETIDEELRRSREGIDARADKRAMEEVLERKARIEQYVQREVAKVYPPKYRRIIEKAKREGILLYEYYLGEYPPDWPYRASAVRNRDGGRCRKCGRQGSELHVHHKKPVIPRWKQVYENLDAGVGDISKNRGLYGDHFLDNLITLCLHCHHDEHPHMADEWLDQQIHGRAK